MDFNNNTYDFSNMFNVEERQLNLEPTKQFGSSTAGLGAKDVSKPKASSSISGVEKLASIWSSIAEAFSDNPDDLVDPYEKGRDQAGEVYSKYDILEPIEDPAKARRIGGLTTKNLPMPVDAPVGRQRFSIFPEAEEEVAEEVIDGLMRDPRKLGGSEGYGSLGKPEKDVEAVADIGDGLMSRDTRNLGGAEGYGNPVGDLSIFSTSVDNLYTEFRDGGLEGAESHLGGADYKQIGITLPLGIVATSGLKYTHNGTTIDLPKKLSKRWPVLKAAGVTTANFDPANVVTTDAVKDGIKRSDYGSDETWTKAIVKSFETSAIDEMAKEGVDTDKLDDSVIEGITSLAWNARGHKWSDIEAGYQELEKTNPDMTKLQSGMLQVFTSNKIVIRGLAARRAKDYNKVAEGLNQPTITNYTPKKLTNGNAGIDYKLSDGTTITRDTGRDYATQASKASFKNFLDIEISI